MNDNGKLGPWIARFLLEHLITERNLARNTQRSYRDTWTLLILFATRKTHRKADELQVTDIGADLVRQFLSDFRRPADLLQQLEINASLQFARWLVL